MYRRVISTALTLVLWISLAAHTSQARANQIDLDEPINLSLADAPVVEVLKSFASIAGVELRAAPEVTGAITIELDAVPIQQALHQTCRLRSLHCELLKAGEDGSSPGVLWVRKSNTAVNPPLPVGLFETISLSLAGASLTAVLEAFEGIAGRPIELAPGLEGLVTLELKHAPWTVALVEVCDFASCQIKWGSTLTISPREEPSQRRRALQLSNIPLRVALESLAGDSIFGSLGPLSLESEEDLSHPVSIDLDQATWPEALNALCHPVGLTCSVRYGIESILEARVKVPTAARAKTTIEPNLRGVGGGVGTGVDLGLRLLDGDDVVHRSAVRLDWQHPSAELETSDAQRLRLAWIPLDPDNQILLPIAYRCDNPDMQVFPPVMAPVLSLQTLSLGTFQLQLQPAEAQASPTPAFLRPCPGRVGADLAVAFSPEAADKQARAKQTEAAGPSPLTLGGQVGALLLLVPVDGKNPTAALVSLGDDSRGWRRLALLHPESQQLRVERLAVAPGTALEILLESTDSTLGLSLPSL